MCPVTNYMCLTRGWIKLIEIEKSHFIYNSTSIKKQEENFINRPELISFNFVFNWSFLLLWLTFLFYEITRCPHLQCFGGVIIV